MTAVSSKTAAKSRYSGAFFLTGGVAFAAVALLLEPVARRELADGRVVDLGPLQLKLAYNSGVAFSFGDQLPLWVLLSITAVITAGIGVYGWRTASFSAPVTVLGFSLIFAGAAANVVDRMIDGKVTDYFHTGWWPTFNLADTFLTCGIVLLLVAHLWDFIRESTPENMS